MKNLLSTYFCNIVVGSVSRITTGKKHFKISVTIIFNNLCVHYIVIVQSPSCVRLFATPWTAACQACLSFTISQSLLKLMSSESVMPSNQLVLCHPFSSCLQSFPWRVCLKGFWSYFPDEPSAIGPCGLFCSVSYAAGVVFQSPKPRNQEC